MDNKQQSSSDSGEFGSSKDSQMALCSVTDTVTSDNGNKETFACPICRTVNTERTNHLEHVATHRSKPSGKTKTFNCKQCQFVAITKFEYWEHSRKHIKPEKLLTCSECPFVTEFKHHLEYHTSTHSGAKPFKCEQCSYSCASQSMLKSHLKSHLTIYQYRCADCSYATKYHHTLKIHLRKYNHQPAVVLNEDGTPNPVKIVDIYGRSRGPKTRPKVTKQRKEVVQKTSIEQTNAIPSIVNHTQVSSVNPIVTSTDSAAVGPSTNGLVNGMVNGVNVVGRLPVMVNNTILETSPSRPVLLPEEKSRKSLSPMDVSECGSLFSNENNVGSDQRQPVTSIKARGSSRRKGKAFKLDRQFVILESESERDERTNSNCSSGEVSIGNKNAEPSLNDNSNDRSYEYRYENNLEDQPIDYSKNVRTSNDPPTSIDSFFNIGSSSLSICQYCDIVFLHEAMYKVHMSYHGTTNPYICFKCGHNAPDKVSFFLHISTTNH